MSKAYQVPSPPQFQRPPLWFSWTLATLLGEFLGFGTVSFLAALVAPTHTDLSFVILLAGLMEGICLGTAQWFVLRRYLPNAIAWIPATAGGALLAWVLGMIPSTVMPMRADEGDTMTEPSLAVLVLAAIAMGFALGAMLGWIQWWVLRVHVRKAWRWIYASAIAWALALPPSFIGPSLIQPGDSMGRIVLLGVLSGVAMGAIAGGVGGFAMRILLKK